MAGAAAAVGSYLVQGAVQGIVAAGFSFAAQALAKRDQEARDVTVGDLRPPHSNEGVFLPYVAGTAKLGGNVNWFGEDFYVTKHDNPIGKRISFAYALCLGPVDKLFAITIGDNVLYETAISRTATEPELVSLGPGNIYLYWGTTTQTSDTRIDALSTPNPAYRRFCYALFNRWFTRGSVPTPHFVVQRKPVSPLTGSALIEEDANPAWVLWELLTDDTMGIGYDTADLDQASFQTAANTLNTESLGISVTVSTPTEALEIFEKILTIINGALIDTGGTIKLVLYRNDFVLGSLPQFDEATNIEPQTLTMTRQSWDDVITDLHVRYIRRDRNFTTRTFHAPTNVAARTAIGHVVTRTMDLPFIPTREVAVKVALSVSRQLGYPQRSFTWEANRHQFKVEVGDRVRLNSTELGVDMAVLIRRIRKHPLSSEKLVYEADEDNSRLWGVGNVTVTDVITQATQSDDTAPIAEQFVTELPSELIGGSTQMQIAIAAAAGDVTTQEIQAHVGIEGANAHTLATLDQALVHAVILLDDLPVGTHEIDDTTTLTVEALHAEFGNDIVSTDRAGMLRGDNLAFLVADDGSQQEIVSIQTITSLGNNQYDLTGILRGMHDTKQKGFEAGSMLWFIDPHRIPKIDSTHLLTDGQDVEVKIAPVGLEAADLSVAKVDLITGQRRAEAPLTVTGMTVDGRAFDFKWEDPDPFPNTIDMAWRYRGKGVATVFDNPEATPAADDTFDKTQMRVVFQVTIGNTTTGPGVDTGKNWFTGAADVTESKSNWGAESLTLHGVAETGYYLHLKAWTENVDGVRSIDPVELTIRPDSAT